MLDDSNREDMDLQIDEEKIRQAAIDDGMFTLRDSGRTRVMAGTTTLEEVAYATTED